MGATTAHKAPEKVADGTCIQVWAWMTNKCKRRMNGGEGYIATEISQGSGGGGESKKGRLLGSDRSWEFTSSDEQSFLPRT